MNKKSQSAHQHQTSGEIERRKSQMRSIKNASSPDLLHF